VQDIQYIRKAEDPRRAAAEKAGAWAGAFAGAKLFGAGGVALGAGTGPFAPVAIPVFGTIGAIGGGLGGYALGEEAIRRIYDGPQYI
jgi:outer membrane lipoprotein SlyB